MRRAIVLPMAVIVILPTEIVFIAGERFHGSRSTRSCQNATGVVTTPENYPSALTAESTFAMYITRITCRGNEGTQGWRLNAAGFGERGPHNPASHVAVR
jgi:hypothetical protein